MRKKDLPEAEVKLKPIAGIRPGVYILAALIASIVIIFFALFFLPGLLSKGGYVSFDTLPSAAIYMDGKYIGSGKGSIYYLPHGEHEFSFAVNGIDAGSIAESVDKPVFGTLFVHRVKNISYPIENTPELESSIKHKFAKNIAEWSRVLDFSSSYSYPPLFQDFVRDAETLGFEDISDELLYGALHVTSKTMYDDYRAAVGESIPEPLAGIDQILRLVYDDGISEYTEPVAAEDGKMLIGNTYAIAFPEVKEHYQAVSIPEAELSSALVTEREFAAFTEAVPYWSKSNIETLIADGVADSNYLRGIRLSSSSGSSPIRNISWYAADAYCRCYGLSLPTEAEWMASDHISGTMWEFTSSSFIPYGRLIDQDIYLRLTELYPYDDIIVKGGSHIKSADNQTVGAMDRAQCSEYASFRVSYGNQADSEE